MSDWNKSSHRWLSADGSFCKHAVALAVVVTDAVTHPNPRGDAVIDVRAYLEGLDPKELVDLKCSGDRPKESAR
jgi:hypothetical protein